MHHVNFSGFSILRSWCVLQISDRESIWLENWYLIISNLTCAAAASHCTHAHQPDFLHTACNQYWGHSSCLKHLYEGCLSLPLIPESPPADQTWTPALKLSSVKIFNVKLIPSSGLVQKCQNKCSWKRILKWIVEEISPFLFYRQSCLINFEIRNKWIGCTKSSHHFARLY